MNIEETIKIMLKGSAEHTEKSEIIKKLEKVSEENRPLRIKLGLDPSAPDIHLGHAVVLRKIKQLQDLGHEAIIIIGDFTGMIGDPTGKSKTRNQLTKEQVVENAKTYEKQIFKVLNKEQTTLRFNSEWLEPLNFREIINLCSKSTIARILERDDFKKRYEAGIPISVHELFYPFMQSYDSVAIRADIELGGSDQLFNILMGRNIQKEYGQDPQITLFMPLLEGIDGIEKMSKSLGNYIGVNEEANTMYAKCMKIPDNLIVKYYELCTDIHPDKIDVIKNRLNNTEENPRNIKMELAKEITKLYHSEELAQNAQEHFETAFSEQKAPKDVEEIKLNEQNFTDVGSALIELILNTKKYASKSEVRRLFSQGGVKLNDEKILDFKGVEKIENGTILQIGKGNYIKIIV